MRASITSVWALDLLVLMMNSGAKPWTVRQLNDDLRASTTLVEEILAGFTRQGLVAAAPDGTYRYAPANDKIGSVAEETARLYAERPLAVIKEIVSAPNEKIHSFVDAFRLKKD